MKSMLQYTLRGAFVAAMALTASCVADDPNFEQLENTIDPDTDITTDANTGVGYLSTAELLLSVNPESELIVTKASSYDEAGDDYIVYIHNEESGEEFYANSYATTKSLTEAVILPVGNYVISAASCDEIPATAWDAPQYASSQYPFSIGADKTTEFSDEIVCKMSNIKTSIEMSVELCDLFKSDINESAGETPLQVLLELGEASLLYAEDETRSGYFAPQDDDDSIDITLSGMYNTAADGETPVYEAIEWKQTITGVVAGQARHISIEIAHYNEGVLEIVFKVTTWVYDTTLGVQMSQAFYTSFEEEIYDPDSDASDPYSPIITIEGDTSLTQYIYPAAFDDEAMTYDPTYTVVMTPEAGSEVSTMVMMFSSSNEEISTLISDAGFGSSITLWSNDSANGALSEWITFSEEASGEMKATVTYAGMKYLGDYRGVHTVKMIVTDSEDRRSVTTLTINSVASDKLEIVWRDGYSFDETYEITAEEDDDYSVLPVVFDIYSKTGLTAMKIKITSDALTPEELLTLNLAQEMDLINPATTAMEASLIELGFPVGDDVEGATELLFDITSFMPLLASLSDAGSKEESQFLITIEDESGTFEVTLTVVRK